MRRIDRATRRTAGRRRACGRSSGRLIARTRLTRRTFGAALGQLGAALLRGALLVLIGAHILGACRGCRIQPARLRGLLDLRLLPRGRFCRLGGALRFLRLGIGLALRGFLAAALEIGLGALAVLGQPRIVLLGLLQRFLPVLFMFGVLGPAQIAVGFHLDAFDLRLCRPQFALDILDAAGDEKPALALHFLVVGRPFGARVGLRDLGQCGLGLSLAADGRWRKPRAQRRCGRCNGHVLGMDLHADSEERRQEKQPERCGRMRAFHCSRGRIGMSDKTHANEIERRIIAQIAEELSVRTEQVGNTVQLLDEGATVPFIARYRKEVTGSLDDTQLRNLAERLVYLRELEERRGAILASIAEQGKLTPELGAAITGAATKQALEDLYLPYKPKRRTRAQIAREAGLEPLARALFDDPTLDPQTEAAKFLNEQVADAKAALDGARDILAEEFAENAQVLGDLREKLRTEGVVRSKLAEGKEAEAEKFRDYFDYAETWSTVPSHRALAIFRGRQLGLLGIALTLDDAAEELVAQRQPHPCESRLGALVGVRQAQRAADAWLATVVRWAWRVKVQPTLETELLAELRERAEDEAIRVFGQNLKDLLLAAPAGMRATMGLDPGLRTGVKVAVVDATGKLLATDTIYPHEPHRRWDAALMSLAALAKQHQVDLISIGNGTASRETAKLAEELIARHPELKLTKVVVSEAGASVYSASEFAAKEFPDLDVSLRGAVSIARRLQDPLAELVKIDPKAIGVGQYQHDVNQRNLAGKLDAVVEDCVNAVGVDVNTASAPLLARVAGLDGGVAKNIVAHREQHGAFRSRAALREVPRLGDKAFEQAAGFLRIVGGEEPLDASAVHPEAYPVVQRILARVGKGLREVMGNKAALAGVKAREFVDERFGLPTVEDILAELDKPGRDPRGSFKVAQFQDGVEDLKDLRPGMVLEGVVTNVAAFGAFVDIGVHQDGLVHISMLSNKFVKDPREVVKAGDIVKVKVLEIDVARKRIGLSMRMDAQPGSTDAAAGGGANRNAQRTNNGPRRDARPQAEQQTALAAAFAKLSR